MMDQVKINMQGQLYCNKYMKFCNLELSDPKLKQSDEQEHLGAYIQAGHRHTYFTDANLYSFKDMCKPQIDEENFMWRMLYIIKLYSQRHQCCCKLENLFDLLNKRG